MDVGVVTYNTGQLTADALRHLLDSDQGCNLRLLVRDNASTDDTVAIIRERVAEAEVDAGTENLGFGRGMNTLLARSTSPWFFALNSDAWPEPGAIGHLVDAGSRYVDAAAIAPRLERPDGSLEHSTLPFPSARVAATMLFAGRVPSRRRREAMQLPGSWQHDRARAVDWAVGAALLMRRRAVDDIGGFDERYFMYAEDLEWCWRAAKRGWSIRFEPDAIVRHVGNASGETVYGGQWSQERTAAYLRNTYRFYRRERGVVAVVLYRALNLLGTLRGYLGERLRGRKDEAHWWAAQLPVHLLPVRGEDGPPSRRVIDLSSPGG